MRRGFWKKYTVLALALLLLMTVTSCVQANTEMKIARNGDATISAVVMMDEESVKEYYGMPTKFYDAVEADSRFSRVSSWEQTYVSEVIDGKNYIGVKRTTTVSKKEVQNALNTLYGNYAKVTYSDKNTFGNRNISIQFSSNGGRLMDDELVAGTHDQVVSDLLLTIPGSISSTNATQLGVNQVKISLLGLVTGKEPKLEYNIKFFDFTFFIPIIAVVVVVVTAAIVVLTKINKTKKQNEGLTSINLKNIKKKPAKGGFSGGDDLDNFMKEKPKKPAFKKTPKYTAEPKAPQTEEAPKAPTPAPFTSKPATPTYRPTAPAAPAAPVTPVAPAAPVAPEAPAPSYTEETPAYTEASYVEETPSYLVGTAKAAKRGGTQEYTYQAGSLRAEEVKEEPMAPYTGNEGNSFFIPKAEYERNGMENQTHEDVDFGEYRKKMSAAATADSTSSYAASSKMYSGTSETDTEYSAGSAKFNKRQGRSELPTTDLFQPRSTAPNLEYFTPGYQTEQKPADNVQPLQTGDTLFQPRSTAPNMDYFMPGHHEEQKPAENVTQFSTGDTLFQPRSLAPNMDYGKNANLPENHDPGNPDPFKTKEESTANSLFTPRSTAPNLAYGRPKDEFADFEPQNVEHKGPSFLKSAAETTPAYEPAQTQPSYDQSAYAYGTTQESYQDTSYGYSDGNYTDSYGSGAYDDSYTDSYEDTGYSDGYYDDGTTQGTGGSIYQTEGYESSSYQSASVGASHKSEAISGAYGGSKLGTGAYLGGAATGATIGRSVGNIGGYVDPETVNTSSYGSDPFSGSPLPKLGEAGADGGGLFSYDANGGFGGNTNTINPSGSFGGSAIGSGTFGSNRTVGSSSTGGTQFTPKSTGTRFGSGTGTGKFDFGAPTSGNRKCPFCKEPIRDDDTFCVACGAELSRPYGSF